MLETRNSPAATPGLDVANRETAPQSGEYTLHISRMLDAPRELVYKAFTDPGMLSQWMGPRGFEAMDIESDMRVGGKWRLRLHKAAEKTDCDPGDLTDLWQHGTYLEVAPPERLVYTFAWENRGDIHKRETTITVTFRELEGKTVMDFKQGAFLTAADRDDHNTGWTSAFDRFAEFLLTPVGQEKPTYELNITRVFDAPRELVWKAWTEPELALNWMGPRGFQATAFTTSSQPGGKWHMTMQGNVPHTGEPVTLQQGGVLREIVPPRLLVYTFAWDDRSCVGLGESPFKENVVTVRFEELGTKTIMYFRQTPFATEGERDGHTGGWNSAFDCLVDLMRDEQPGKVSSPDDVPSELHIKRFFAAPRSLVFEAWTDPEMLSHWWGPRGFTNPVCEIDAVSGGELRIHMKAPDGTIFPMTGRFLEVYPPYRFHFTATPLDNEGNAVFENWNSVFFAEVDGGTEVTLDVHVVKKYKPIADQFLKGMTAGWNQTLDRLGEFVTKAEVLQ